MSSVYVDMFLGQIHHASHANDGIYRPTDKSEAGEKLSIAHTSYQSQPWWRVDLEKIYCVWAVNILNRGDGMTRIFI